MTSARRIKLRVALARPRNPLVAPAAQRKAGRHRPSKSGQRQQEQARLRREIKDL